METAISSEIRDALGAAPTDATELDGGMIGTVYRVTLADGRRVVAKTGDTPLETEAYMLRHLAAHGLPVPGVYHASDDLLVMEYVDGDGEITPGVERDAAEHLAALHDVTAEAFGMERDTLTGPLRQPNPWTDSWVGFFRDRRLRYMAGLAREASQLPVSLYERVAAVADDLDDLLVEASPSLVHGDVWRTNLLVGDDEVKAFVDPAAYYAHAEVELAYIAWTETFGDPFFERYRELRGIDDGFETRRHVYALYPLLTHVRLFGDRFVAELETTLETLGY